MKHLLFLNMQSRVTLGTIQLNNISGFEINETIDELSNTAKIIIPRNYGVIGKKPVLDLLAVGNKVLIESGYDGDKLNREFVGYIREIESDAPIIIHCDDESFLLKQTCIVKSYRKVTLSKLLADILPAGITYECPDVNLGKTMVDKESVFQVLNRIKEVHGLYSRLHDGHLTVGLRDMSSVNISTHIYRVGVNIRKNDLKYKRKEDYKLLVKVTSILANGKKKTAEYGSKDKEASQYNVSMPGNLSEAELLNTARRIYNQRCYDGYTGTITGFGVPVTHAGDSLLIKDDIETDRTGRYMIEKVDIVYNNNDGYARTNTLSYKIE